MQKDPFTKESLKSKLLAFEKPSAMIQAIMYLSFVWISVMIFNMTLDALTLLKDAVQKIRVSIENPTLSMLFAMLIYLAGVPGSIIVLDEMGLIVSHFSIIF